MPKNKLIGNVAEFGLFQSLARSRARIITSALVSALVSTGLALVSAHYILERSDSVGLNMLLITLNMLVLMVSAYLLAIVVGDLCFAGPWREQVILGLRPELDERDDRDTLVVRDHTAEFLIAIGVIFALHAAALNVMAGGFLDRYHNEAFFEVRMRAEDPEERIAALRDMASPTQSALWERAGARAVARDALTDAHPEVRAQAAWTAGTMGLIEARPALVTILRDTAQPEATRAAAALALGRMGDAVEARDALIQTLAQARSEALRHDTLRAMALMRAPAFGDTLARHIESPDEMTATLALWALRQGPAVTQREAVHAALSRATPGQRRCALLDALKFVGDDEDLIWARKQFAREDPGERCETRSWEDRDERRHTLIYGDPPRAKLLKIVANAGQAKAQRAWFEQIVADNGEPYEVRQVAGQVLKQLGP